MTKVYLSRKGIAFTEKNISLDPVARDQLLALGYRTTPMTAIGGTHILGYKPQALEEALKAAGIVS